MNLKLIRKIDKLEQRVGSLEEAYKHLLETLRDESHYQYRDMPLKNLIKILIKERQDINKLLKQLKETKIG